MKKSIMAVALAATAIVVPSARADTWTADFSGSAQPNVVTASAAGANDTTQYYAAAFAPLGTDTDSEWGGESLPCQDGWMDEAFSGGAPAPCDLAVASAARSRGYRCWKHVKSTKHSGWLFFQWGLTLIDRYCGYVNGNVRHHWADVYTSTGIGWDVDWTHKGGAHYANRVTSMGQAKFRFGLKGVSYSTTRTVGINADTSGHWSGWKS